MMMFFLNSWQFVRIEITNYTHPQKTGIIVQLY